MKHKWPMIGPYTSLDSDLQQIFESHGIDVTAYEVQPRHGDDIDALWTIEGQHIGLQEQREDLIHEDGQQFAVITFPVESHQEFEQQREANKMPDENWYYVNSQTDVATELDSPIQKLQKLASKEERQSADEAVEIVKETLQELQAIRNRKQLYPENQGSKSAAEISSKQLLDQSQEPKEEDADSG